MHASSGLPRAAALPPAGHCLEVCCRAPRNGSDHLFNADELAQTQISDDAIPFS
jgi:hypothetical protein